MLIIKTTLEMQITPEYKMQFYHAILSVYGQYHKNQPKIKS
jgi:hypothetical protein